IQVKDVDLRDPKLSITADGRLMMVGGAAEPASRNPVRDHYSFVCFSNGATWSKPERVLDSWQWLWRVTWHKDTAYGVAYQWYPKAHNDSKGYKAFLCQSKDGLRFTKVTDFDIPNATEATLRFDGDRMLCLQRRDGRPNTAMLGVSQPPYKQWNWKNLGLYFGGPNFLRLPDGTWAAAGRMIQEGKPRTVVCRLDIEETTLTPKVQLPSSGDTSHPGLRLQPDPLLVRYYNAPAPTT